MSNIAPIAFVVEHQAWLKLFKSGCANYIETQKESGVMAECAAAHPFLQLPVKKIKFWVSESWTAHSCLCNSAAHGICIHSFYGKQNSESKETAPIVKDS